MMDRVVKGTFLAQTEYPIGIEMVKIILIEVAQKLYLNTAEINNEVDNFVNKTKIKLVISNQALGSIFYKWKKEGFCKNILTPSQLESLFMVTKTELNIFMYPEKIFKLAELLNKCKIFSWCPKNISDNDHKLWRWFATNIRNINGEIDWKRIKKEINQYGEFTLNLQVKKIDKLTPKIALIHINEIAKEILTKKEIWTPTDLSNNWKQLYCFIITLAKYRKDAKRPDILNKNVKEEFKNSRPNWWIIIKDLSPDVADRFSLGTIEEQQYRDFDDAIEELIDMIEQLNPKYWGASWIEKKNTNLYKWFTNHCRHKDIERGLNWEMILDKLPEHIKNKFVFQKEYNFK